MKVYLVNAWYDYYPSSDNTVAVFSKLEDAKEFILKRFREERYHPDHMDIFEKEVE